MSRRRNAETASDDRGDHGERAELVALWLVSLWGRRCLFLPQPPAQFLSLESVHVLLTALRAGLCGWHPRTLTGTDTQCDKCSLQQSPLRVLGAQRGSARRKAHGGAGLGLVLEGEWDLLKVDLFKVLLVACLCQGLEPCASTCQGPWAVE